MRQVIKSLEQDIAALRDIKHKHIKEYVKSTPGALLYITDHAKVRFLERGENLLLLGTSDKERLLSAGKAVYNLRDRMLSREEQERILLNDLTRWHRGTLTFIIANLTVITVTSR
jgi:hypothetical protein